MGHHVQCLGSLFTFDTIGGRIAPEALVADRNVIFVSISSRLNVFGFLSLENVIIPGNMGFLDQYYALFWLRENIQYFGGDGSRLVFALIVVSVNDVKVLL